MEAEERYCSKLKLVFLEINSKYRLKLFVVIKDQHPNLNIKGLKEDDILLLRAQYNK
ncbi:hypothetical protein TTHERM_000513197 (macronuclear) [Tetrahymena thermophila SB210]|uniref:Uncharacterized protein n=1 Tax=Tetrahymena thermophila (strain SB210) TaxID=312017 RepID=W7X5A7_TETTS|nr:hypothetical protein TTHERM_000513197 [Tetrahymena thermophila SB210]EWS74545.1 hypothetical protein TTHERM_000513197 [Tetrahymena thermophila SB210]|eukprot:XP_012652919.1 hypothetical protein TTHERM_000513197 [Tetrahymena thermophila SB210]